MCVSRALLQDVRSKNRGRMSDKITQVRIVDKHVRDESLRLRHTSSGRSDREVPHSKLLAVAAWRLAGVPRSVAMSNARAGMKAPWPPAATGAAAAWVAVPGASVEAAAHDVDNHTDISGVPSDAVESHELDDAMADQDQSAEFMNDCLVSGLGGISETDGLFKLAVDAEARTTSVEKRTADRGPAVSADADVGDVETAVTVLETEEDEDDAEKRPPWLLKRRG